MRVNGSWIIVGACMGIALITWACLSNERLMCEGSHATIRCLAESPIVFQLIGDMSNPVFDRALKDIKADPCSDIRKTTDTFAVGSKLVPNHVHYSEEISEAAAIILREKPECFLKAAQLADRKTKELFVKMLDYFDGDNGYQSKGRGAFKDFQNDPKYVDIIHTLKTHP